MSWYVILVTNLVTDCQYLIHKLCDHRRCEKSKPWIFSYASVTKICTSTVVPLVIYCRDDIFASYMSCKNDLSGCVKRCKYIEHCGFVLVHYFRFAIDTNDTNVFKQ